MRLVRAQDVEHIGIIGPGTIDGNRTKRHGPKPIALKNCRHIAVRDITIRNSPNYNISLLGCDYVNIEGVTILNGYATALTLIAVTMSASPIATSRLGTTRSCPKPVLRWATAGPRRISP